MKWKKVAKTVKRIFNTFGVDVTRYRPEKDFPLDLTKEERDVIHAVLPFTMTGHFRVCAMINAVKYVVNAQIPGSIVECGVWRGGSMMAAAMTLLNMGDTSRVLWLYDTFTGMNLPTEFDEDSLGQKAADRFRPGWCFASLEEVKENLFRTGYPKEQIRFIKGKVEDTIPAQIPEDISLLRLDTDWYESTRHELIYLYPKLVKGGVLILDDYGHWKGSRKAVDEYLRENNLTLLLNRIDSTARIALKP